jgi:hypothetical protein
VTADRLVVVVDGHSRAVRQRLDAVRNGYGLRVGGPGTAAGDDQFHGVVDDVVVCYPRCT